MNFLNAPYNALTMVATIAVCGLILLYSVGGSSPEPAAGAADAAESGRSFSVSAYGGSLSRALHAIGARETTLCIDAPATVDGDTTTPPTLGLVFRKGGCIKFGDKKLRLNGPLEAGPYRIFEGSGEVTLADNAVTELFVEWWGGAADGATDNTPAFAAAVAAMAHPTIRLLQGTYLGVVAANGKVINLHGSGKSKTVLKNNDPEAHTIALGACHNSFISDLKVDLNGAGKTGVKLDGCTYLDMQRVCVSGQGTAGKYALHVTGCTLSSFQDIIISYGAMHVDRSYYSHFKNVSIAEPRDDLPTLHIASTAALQFYGLYVEHGKQGSIVLEEADNTNFYGIGIEIADAVPAGSGFIRVRGGLAVNFYGGHINQYSNAGWPMFDLEGVRGCTIDGWLLRRSVEDSSPFVALGSGLDNIQISNIEFWANPVPAIGIQSAAGAESRAGNVILENLTHWEQPVRYILNAEELSTRNVKGALENR